MILLSQLPKKITTRLSQKTKVSEKLLKIIFLGGILGFSFSLLIFKFAILSQLNQLELSRLSLIKNFPNLTSGISDPLQAFGQFITTNIFKNHQIFAMKLPGSLMLTLAIISTAATLYIKFRNRYLPYTYLLLTTTSPLIILLGHQSYIPGIDTLFLISVILASYFAIIATDLRAKLKSLLFAGICFSVGLLSLQNLGLPLFALSLILIFKSTEFRYQALAFKKISRLTSYLLLLLPLGLNLYINYKNRNFWQIISGYQNFKDLIPNLKETLNVLKTIFGFSGQSHLSTGTLRPDFLLIACIALTVFEAFKKLRGRLFIIVLFLASIILSGLFGGINSIIFASLIAPVFISLVLANMVGIIDVAFPINPYPRNLAKSFILALICILSLLNIYVFMSATIRQNLPQKIDLYYQLKKH